MKKKIIIHIDKGRYAPSCKNGAEYTDVHFQASRYGGGSPCDNPIEVEDAIQHFKEWIEREGDIPIVENHIEEKTLGEWLK